LSDAEAEHSVDSLTQKKGKEMVGGSISGSDLPTEVEYEGDMVVKSETILLKERRDRQKAYYLHVNHSGKSYRDGVSTWRADLNKLSRGLNPSVMDVREQPSTEMATLRRRLRQTLSTAIRSTPYSSDNLWDEQSPSGGIPCRREWTQERLAQRDLMQMCGVNFKKQGHVLPMPRSQRG